MMHALVRANLNSSYKVGHTDNVSITHLHLGDDILLVGNTSLANIKSLKALLLLFEVTLGLKVNFHKSMFVSVNVSNFWLKDDSMVLNCKIGHVPFFYLGLPIGGDSQKLNFWKPLVERVNSRLSWWKSRNLSLDGRLVLMKCLVLSPDLLHFLPQSFCKYDYYP